MYTILIVDDEQLTRSYMKATIPLIDPRWQVTHEAMDGQEALDLAQTHHFDLIITDIKMPVMDGLALCKIISEQYPAQRVIILSGYDEFTLAKEAIHYGVHEYLLKPIVKEELCAALDRVTLDIDRRKNQVFAYKTLQTLSHDLQNQFVKNFLKAVISDSNAEIKVLYPLIFRLKISLIESEGNLLLLALDDDVYMSRELPLRDIPIFKYIVNQIAKELIEDEQLGNVFYDSEENTMVLVKGDSEEELLQRSQEIYGKVAAAIEKSTSLTITGAIGSPVSDVLQLNASYAKTRQILLSRLVFGGNTVYMDTGFSTSEINKQKLALELQTLDNIISTLKSGLLDHNERIYSVAVTHYAELFETWSFPTFYRYGAYLIRSIAELDSRFPMNAALTSLKAFGLSGKGKLIQDDMVTLFNGIMKTFAQSIMPDKREHDENDLVSRAKQYIYAHFSEPISLALIAEVVGVSPSYLSSIFHKSVNESYIRFLTRIRMEEAAKLLQSKPLKKIVDVAEMVGYVSVKHFSYVFKQHFRMPPGEYQEKL